MAKIRRPVPPPVQPGEFPAELSDPTALLWQDVDAMRRHPEFGPFVNDRVVSRMRMLAPRPGRAGRWAHVSVGGAWLRAHGHESSRLPGTPDWSAVR